jgi:hypothetical protein
MPVQTCSTCAYWQSIRDDDGLCRRRAPAAASRAEEVAHWPQTHGYQGCGEGKPASSEKLATCGSCAFWRRYNGGMHPMNRADMPNSWWGRAGLCVKRAPEPSTEPGPRGFWRATANADSCGEGVPAATPVTETVPAP